MTCFMESVLKISGAFIGIVILTWFIIGTFDSFKADAIPVSKPKEVKATSPSDKDRITKAVTIQQRPAI